MRVGPGERAGLGRPREAEAAAPGRAAGRRAHLGPGPHRDKDGEGRARHVEADAARARRRSRSYSPIRKRRRDSPSFMEPRRITRYGAPLGTSRRDLGRGGLLEPPGAAEWTWCRERWRLKERRWGFSEKKRAYRGEGPKLVVLERGGTQRQT